VPVRVLHPRPRAGAGGAVACSSPGRTGPRSTA
jgi:hypothetical protein